MKSSKNVFLGLLFALPVLVAFFMIFKYGVNIPFWDDFDTVFSFLAKYLDAGGWGDRFKLVFAQHTEHRFALNRVVVLLNYYLSNIDFKVLMVVGNLALVGLLAVLYKSVNFDAAAKGGAAVANNKLFLLLPVPFLLFQPQYNESIYWATAALCNFYILFFAFLSLFLLSRSGKLYFVLSVIFALLATFTMGNGMFVFVVGLMVLLYQKKYLRAGIYLLIAAGTIAAYFQAYITTADHPSLAQTLSHPLQIVIYFFTLIGSPIGSFHLAWLSPYIGGAVFVYFLFLTCKSYFKKNVVVYSYFLFLFATVFVIAFSRSGFGLEQAFASKYTVVVILFYVLGYISLVESFPALRAKKFVIGFIGIAVCFNVVSYLANINDIKAHHDALVNGAVEWKKNVSAGDGGANGPVNGSAGLVGVGLVYPDKDRANTLLLDAGKRGIYELLKSP